MPIPTIAPAQGVDTFTTVEPEVPWNVFLWNDPVTIPQYVVWVLKDVLGLDNARATAAMITAHTTGKAVVFTGSKDQAESHCVRLHASGLQATIAKDE
jgi:ATP-dependent Clp protease adaptor protein ClpS